MDVERVVVFVIERELAKEFDVCGRDGGDQICAERREVPLAAHMQRLTRVLLESAFAPDRRMQPERRALVNKVEQHLFVIAAQAEDALRLFVVKFDDIRDRAGHVLAAINDVA